MQQASIIIMSVSPSQQTACGMAPGCMYMIYDNFASILPLLLFATGIL